MVKVSAITLPALLAVLATLSAAAPTAKARSDIVAANSAATYDVEPSDYSNATPEAPQAPEETVETVSIEARHEHNYRPAHWGYKGYWWSMKNGKWYVDYQKYSYEYDQEYRRAHPEKYSSYWDRNGYMYKWNSMKKYWEKTMEHNDIYDQNYWGAQNYKRDVEQVDAAADFSIEARHEHNYRPAHWGYKGYWWSMKNGKWCVDYQKYSYEYDQEYRRAHPEKYSMYWDRNGYMYKWNSMKKYWEKTMEHNDIYDQQYWGAQNYKRDVEQVDAAAADFALEARDIDEVETSDFALEARHEHKGKHMDHKDYYDHSGYRHHWNGKSWEVCEYNPWYNQEHKPYYSQGYLYQWNIKSNCYERYGNYNKSYKDGPAY